MKAKLILSVFFLVTMLSSCKDKINKGDATLNLQVYNSCNEPYKSIDVKLYKENMSGGLGDLIAQKNTDNNGFVSITHSGGAAAVYNLKVNDILVSTYNGYLYNTTYYMNVCSQGNAAIIPVELTDYASYTSQDTLYYRVTDWSGTNNANDLLLRHKVGPFNNQFIDTLTFPSCASPAVLSYSKDKITIMPIADEHNFLAWGKGYNAYHMMDSLQTSVKFKLVGCGVVDTILLKN